jgi:hypothetical protein
MKFSLAPRIQRWIAWGLLAAICGTLWLGLIQPVFDYLDAGAEQRGIALRALKRDRALIQEQPAILAAADSLKESPRWHNFYTGQRAEAATLQLETDLRSIFEGSNNLTAMTAEPAVAQGPVTRLAVRATLSLRVDDLAKVLDRLQKHAQQLRIESLTIQAPDLQASQINPMLNIQAEIASWMLTPPADGTGRT